MNRWTAGIVLSAALAVAAAPAIAQEARSGATPEADVPPEIADLRNNLIDAFNKKEVDRMLTYLHPDIVVTWQNAEVSHGREGVRKYYERMMVGPNSIVLEMKTNPVVEGRKV